MSYSTVLRPVQYCLSFGNAVFVLLHWAQTQLSYDGLAQDCHLLLPQVALGGLFAWCLLMESGRRGLAFGHIRPFSKGLLEFARKYHSYYFSFAILFNFWYHPMEGTVQHISGFLYQFLIMVQSVLVLTPIHRHATWTVLLEAGATLHATIVSTIAYPRVWRMFCFGFSFKFFVTEVHGLGQGRGIRAFLTLCYVITYLLVYRQYEYTNMTEILRIPVIHYTSTLLLSIILHWVMWIHNIQWDVQLILHMNTIQHVYNDTANHYIIFAPLFFFFPSFTMLCMNTICVIYIYGFMLLKTYYAMLQYLQVSPLCFPKCFIVSL